MKKVIDFFKENFTLLFSVMLIVSLLDLIGIGGKYDIGLGFILSLLYFIAYFIYKWRTPDPKYPEKPEQL